MDKSNNKVIPNDKRKRKPTPDEEEEHHRANKRKAQPTHNGFPIRQPIY